MITNIKRRETRQREAILSILRNTRSHPTADQIYFEVKKQIPHISKGTVYRNLQVLNEDGAISTLILPGTLSRYDAGRTVHYHFRCDKCGQVTDLNEPVDKEIEERVSRKTGFKVYSHQTEFRGLCSDCQQ